MSQNLRVMLGRAAFTEQEVATMRGAIHALARGRGRYLTLVLAGIAVFAVAVLVVATGDLGRVTLGILSIVFLLVLLMAATRALLVHTWEANSEWAY